MTAETWKTLETLFEQALELPVDQRAEFLSRIADTEVRDQVESLLASQANAKTFLETPNKFFSTDDFGQSIEPGDLLGHYRIVREIGRGGMGAVFLAERADDEYRKQVAIKVIKRGTDTDAVLRYFRNERQILAGFDHPHIVRLLDGGATADGLPYFVMDYVEGLPIDEYCKTHSLDVTQRLQLFREVCAAVSYAHRRLVIHRDLKRSNILVTSEGVPKLLDFGIAKILQEEDAGGEFRTLTGQRPLTPEYASPEQVRGETMTTASDVYSLGVLFYELLTGRSPYDLATRSPQEVERAITQQVPARPSAAVGNQENARLLKGDLDNIALMALRKEPERRYQSVDQFSRDIGRYLEHRPVSARTDSFAYRAGKYIRRNRLPLAAAALVLFSLIAGIIGTARQARIAHEQQARAEQRFAEVRELAHSLLFDYHDAIKSLPGATKVRERLVKDALAHLDRLAAQAQNDASLQRDLAGAYERVGDVRGGGGDGNLGDTAGAVDSYTKALSLREGLLQRNPTDFQAARELARTERNLGTAQRSKGDLEQGMAHLRPAAARLARLAQEQPRDLQLQFDLASTRSELAMAVSDKNVPEAIRLYQAAISTCEKLVAAQPDNQRFCHLLWACYANIGNAFSLQSDTDAAIAANRKAETLAEALIKLDPANATYRRHLVMTYESAALYLRRRQPSDAADYFDRAEKMASEIAAADPADFTLLTRAANIAKQTAELHANLGNYAQALAYFRKAAASYDKANERSVNPEFQLLSLDSSAGAAGVQFHLGQVDAGIAGCTQAQTRLARIPDDPNNVSLRRLRAETQQYLGNAYRALAESQNLAPNRRAEYMSTARDMFAQSKTIIDDLAKRQPSAKHYSEWSNAVAADLANCDKALASSNVQPRTAKQ